MSKQWIIAVGLAVLAVVMVVLGAVGGLVPPALTGVGFALLAWAHWPAATEPKHTNPG